MMIISYTIGTKCCSTVGFVEIMIIKSIHHGSDIRQTNATFRQPCHGNLVTVLVTNRQIEPSCKKSGKSSKLPQKGRLKNYVKEREREREREKREKEREREKERGRKRERVEGGGYVSMWVCVCLCMREREREREMKRGSGYV